MGEVIEIVFFALLTFAGVSIADDSLALGWIVTCIGLLGLIVFVTKAVRGN